MAELTVRLWLLAWPDGRVHAATGAAPPRKWAELVKSDGCLCHEASATVEAPAARVATPVEVKTMATSPAR